METYQFLTNHIKQQLIDWRRFFHQNPELSFKEYRTTEYIIKHLKTFGELEIIRPCETGAVAVIRGKKPGHDVAFRADIDALPITEDNDVPYKSKFAEAMHACGHDAHTAILLGAAKILSSLTDEIEGNIYLIFQPAEEIAPGGAIGIINSGILDKVELIFGAHVRCWSPVGTFGIRPGVIFASVFPFEMEIKGKSTHSAFYFKGIDPIYVGANIVTAFNGVISRFQDSAQRASISTCEFKAGNSYSSIPSNAKLKGVLRVLNDEAAPALIERFSRVAYGICNMYGAECSLKWIDGYKAVTNNPDVVNAVKNVLSNVFGNDSIFTYDPVLGGEDFGAYLKNIPGAYYYIGAKKVHKDGIVYPSHSNRFDIDENALLFGTEACVNVLLKAPSIYFSNISSI